MVLFSHFSMIGRIEIEHFFLSKTRSALMLQIYSFLSSWWSFLYNLIIYVSPIFLKLFFIMYHSSHIFKKLCFFS